MNTTISAVGEFDLSSETLQKITEQHFRTLLTVICTADAARVLELDKSIPLNVSITEPPAMSSKKLYGDASADLERLFNHVRHGYAVAIATRNSDSVETLKAFGYIANPKRTDVSERLERNWIVTLKNYLSKDEYALVFGHDFDPVFVFHAESKGSD